MRTCRKCEIKKGFSEFPIQRTIIKGKLYVYPKTICKTCEKKYMAEYNKKNKITIQKNKKLYAEKNKDKTATYQKKYAEKNKEGLSAYKGKYRKTHREVYNKGSEKWRKNNKDKVNQISRDWWRRNRKELYLRYGDRIRRKANKYTDELTNWYILNILKTLGWHPDSISKDVIETKKIIIKIKRYVKESTKK